MLLATLVFAMAMAAPSGAATVARLDAANADKDKLVCRREVPVGSLIASRKMCLTKEQWRKREDDGNASARNMVENGAGACGQNGGVCPF